MHHHQHTPKNRHHVRSTRAPPHHNHNHHHPLLAAGVRFTCTTNGSVLMNVPSKRCRRSQRPPRHTLTEPRPSRATQCFRRDSWCHRMTTHARQRHIGRANTNANTPDSIKAGEHVVPAKRENSDRSEALVAGSAVITPHTRTHSTHHVSARRTRRSTPTHHPCIQSAHNPSCDIAPRHLRSRDVLPPKVMTKPSWQRHRNRRVDVLVLQHSGTIIPQEP